MTNGSRDATLSPDRAPKPPGVTDARQAAWNAKRAKLLRWLGVLLLIGSVVVLIRPIKWLERNAFGSFPVDCGVPLQGLFRPPGSGCGNKAMNYAGLSALIAGLGVILLAFSGIRHRLRFLGFIMLGASVYLMMFPAHQEKVATNTFQCGSAIGGMARRGITQITMGSSTWSLDPRCDNVALTRLRVSIGIAMTGLLLVGISAWRRTRAERELTTPPT